MMGNRTWMVSLTRMTLLVWVMLTFLILFPAFAQETKMPTSQKPWTGMLKDGREITQADLDQILRENASWWKSGGKAGRQADLSEAYLLKANLTKADLIKANLAKASLFKANLSMAEMGLANLTGAILDSADLRGASLVNVNLSGASLRYANLSGADLQHANLKGAELIGANLSKVTLNWANLSRAILSRTDLSGANLNNANVDGAIFEPEPGKLPNVSQLLNIQGLSSLQYKESPHALVELREAFKKAGIRYQEREVTLAINDNNQRILWKNGAKEWSITKILESLFQLVCFRWTCQYGLSPGRPLKILGLALLIFAIPYMLALKSKKSDTGIWVVWLPDRVLKGEGQDQPVKLTTVPPSSPPPTGMWDKFLWQLKRVLRILHLGLYFSLISAFSLGWHDLNVGSWISRVQKKEYTLRATGWVRSVAGLQSLFSVYMLALWVLSYFGRPFD